MKPECPPLEGVGGGRKTNIQALALDKIASIASKMKLPRKFRSPLIFWNTNVRRPKQKLKHEFARPFKKAEANMDNLPE